MDTLYNFESYSNRPLNAKNNMMLTSENKQIHWKFFELKVKTKYTFTMRSIANRVLQTQKMIIIISSDRIHWCHPTRAKDSVFTKTDAHIGKCF